MHYRNLVILEVRNFVILVVCNRKSATAYFLGPTRKSATSQKRKKKKTQKSRCSKHVEKR